MIDVRAVVTLLLLLARSESLVLDLLTGVFDNGAQAAADALMNRPTAALGGHEHVVLTSKRHPRPNTLIISYCFANEPTKPFRFRYYEFVDPCNMKIFSPSKQAIETLKRYSYDTSLYLPDFGEMVYMDSCDVVWKEISSPKPGYFGTLTKGSVILDSIEKPGVKIRVEDSLYLFHDEIHINDRVFTMEGKQIIGNVLGVPYILKRMQL